MNRLSLARILLSIILVLSSVLSFVLDWSPNHLLNPLWHPHARFHGALLLFFLAGVCLTVLWLLWRKSAEPEIAIRAACLLAVAYWTPLFYVPFFLPIASWWAGIAGHEPRIGGNIVYPNLIVAAAFLLCLAYSFRLSFARAGTRA